MFPVRCVAVLVYSDFPVTICRRGKLLQIMQICNNFPRSVRKHMSHAGFSFITAMFARHTHGKSY